MEVSTENMYNKGNEKTPPLKGEVAFGVSRKPDDGGVGHCTVRN